MDLVEMVEEEALLHMKAVTGWEAITQWVETTPDEVMEGLA